MMRLPMLLSFTFCLSFLRCEAGHTIVADFREIAGVGPGVFTGMFDSNKYFTVGEGNFRVTATILYEVGAGLYTYHGIGDGRIDVGDSPFNGTASLGDFDFYFGGTSHVLTVYMGSFDGVALLNEENLFPGITYRVQIDDITNVPDAGNTGLALATAISFLIFAGRKFGSARKQTVA